MVTEFAGDIHVMRLFKIRRNDVEPMGRGISQTQKLEILGLVSFFAAIVFIAIGNGTEVTTAKVLDLLGTVNAAFLVLTSYRHDLMPAYFKPRHKAIVSTGLTVLRIPCGWLCRKAFHEAVLEVPIAIVGLGGYLTVTILSIAGAPATWVALIAGIGVLASARLMQIMFLTIRVSCPFCIFSAGTMTSVFVLALLQM